MQLYLFFNIFAAFLVVLYNLLQYKKKKRILGGVSLSVINHYQGKARQGFKKILGSSAFWIIVETLLVTMAQYFSGLFLNNLFGSLVGTGANYFGLVFFAPLLVVLLCIVLKIDPLAQLDLITPAYPLALTFSKIACYFAGCCRGVVWEKGYYNPASGLVEFPAQLLEAGVAFVLFIFLFSLRNKFKKGTIFPTYLMVYSTIRFCTEFTRWEPRVFMGLKTYQLICVVGVVIGAIEYFIVWKYSIRVQEKEKIKETKVE